MQKLVILDYTNCEVHVYDVDDNVEIDYSLVADLGYNLSMCHYMAGVSSIIQHEEIIK